MEPIDRWAETAAELRGFARFVLREGMEGDADLLLDAAGRLERVSAVLSAMRAAGAQDWIARLDPQEGDTDG